MANLAVSYDVNGGFAGNRYYEQGSGQTLPVGSPQISATASLGSPSNGNFQNSKPGPWIETTTVRYQILLQDTVKLHCFKSTDGGNSWTEMDAAHAPAVNNNSALPFQYVTFAAARDTNQPVRKIYCAFWDTDSTVSGIVFDMSADTWGPVKKSTLVYLDTVNTSESGSNNTGFAGIFRSVDSSLIVAQAVNATSHGFVRVYYAKFNVSAGTWDSAWTACGSTTDAELRDWNCFGMVLDLSGNVHMQMCATARSPTATVIYHQVLHTGNTLSVPDQVASIPNLQLTSTFLGRPIGRTVPGGGGIELIFLWWQLNAALTHIQGLAGRGIAGDTPSWSTEVLLDPGALATADRFSGCELVDVGDGTIQGVIIPTEYNEGSGPSTWLYLANSAPGAGWTTSAFTSCTSGDAPGLSDLSVVLASVPSPPAPLVVDPDPQGAFELLRVTATMRPARHLPVRGSSR